MKYILDHYYCINHKENCLIIESYITFEDLIEIIVSINFLFEEMDNGKHLHEPLLEQCLLKILIKYYGVKDIKNNYREKELNLISKELPLQCSDYKLKTFTFNEKIEFCIIDLYGARESQCGSNYKKIMDKWLPKGKDLEELKDLLRKEGVEKKENEKFKLENKSYDVNTSVEIIFNNHYKSISSTALVLEIRNFIKWRDEQLK